MLRGHRVSVWGGEEGDEGSTAAGTHRAPLCHAPGNSRGRATLGQSRSWPGPPQPGAARSFRGPPGERTGPDWRPGREIQVDSSAGYADPDRTSTLGNLEGNDFNFFFSLFFLDSPVT